jgi:hypothetical protein
MGPGKVVQWKGRDDDRNQLAGGVHFSVITAGKCAPVRKSVMIK